MRLQRERIGGMKCHQLFISQIYFCSLEEVGQVCYDMIECG